jgi:ABC-type transport system involved in multi-copper enzyme maturation permease subunit
MLRTIQAVGEVVLLEVCRRKDVYVLFVLTAVLTLLAGSVTFFRDLQVVRFVMEVALLLIWVSSLVIGVTLAARHLPMERESRTIFPLLAKPISRTQLLLGKFWGCWLACGAALLVFYLFFCVLVASRSPDLRLLPCLQAFLLHWAMLAVVVAMTLLGSLVFAAPSSTNTIVLIVCAAILLLGRHLGKIAMTLAQPGQSLLYAVYFAIPHLEFFDVRDLIVHHWPPVPWRIAAAALAYAAAYTAMFLSLAAALFRRKSLA